MMSSITQSSTELVYFPLHCMCVCFTSCLGVGNRGSIQGIFLVTWHTRNDKFEVVLDFFDLLYMK